MILVLIFLSPAVTAVLIRATYGMDVDPKYQTHQLQPFAHLDREEGHSTQRKNPIQLDCSDPGALPSTHRTDRGNIPLGRKARTKRDKRPHGFPGTSVMVRSLVVHF